jgi:alpha-tubulin suppressor-like RCC1 family protein
LVTAPRTVNGLSICSAGGYWVDVIKKDGTMAGWGADQYGQIGDGTSGAGNNKPSPVTVTLPKGTVSSVVAGGNNTYAMMADGSLYAVGDNTYAELGNGASGGIQTAWGLVGISGINGVYTGQKFALATKPGGTLWDWGYNVDGELGDGTSGAGNYQLSPKKISGIKNVASVSGGNNHTLALKHNGNVWAWGLNANGQLGQGGSAPGANSLVPERVPGLSNVSQVAAGFYSSIALEKGADRD